MGPGGDIRNAANLLLLDYFVGCEQQTGWHVEAKRSRGLPIDDELKLDRLGDRQIGRFRALENLAGIEANLTGTIRIIGAIAHQPADPGIVATGVTRGYPVACRQSDKLYAAAYEERVGPDEQ